MSTRRARRGRVGRLLRDRPVGDDARASGFGRRAARNLPAALLVARENFDDPRVTIMVIVVALLSLIVLGPLATGFVRHDRLQTLR